MKKHLLFILVAITGLTSCVEEPKLYQDTYEGNFEALWKLIDTRYCFLDYKQINWDSIYVVYHAHLDVVHDDLAFFDLMANMLNELKDGHVNLYSGFDISRYWKWYTDYPSNFNDSLI
ncbi:MAG: peptidase S41, partial [Bacteroidota bacterium]|nr:peptidase S41 [Bacteroidota bacterium]